MINGQYNFLEVRYESDICYICINRPEKMNALNITLLQEIREAALDARTKAHGIILFGSGTKAFAAGADIAEFADFNAEQGKAMSSGGHDVMDTLEQSPIPVIAAINGFALGGGCELAMACHLRVATASSKFGQPEVNLGLVPGYGGTQRLPLLIGRSKGLELLLTGDMIGAEEAERLGLINAVVDEADLLPTCEKLIRKIAAKSPNAIAKTIALVNDLYKDGVNGMESEQEAFGDCFNSEEFREGTDAFLNKRKADFRK
ncbi:MAG: enoyl-CoA hydratase/isomerase family protein [Flavobacteriales bacterium]|nr:enoyl-CoA hydratase/isomerase family protein [Flavobacteriales bacterium]